MTLEAEIKLPLVISDYLHYRPSFYMYARDDVHSHDIRRYTACIAYKRHRLNSNPELSRQRLNCTFSLCGD